MYVLYINDKSTQDEDRGNTLCLLIYMDNSSIDLDSVMVPNMFKMMDCK